MKKIIFRFIKVFVLVYCIIGIVLYYLQDFLLFHPSPMQRHERFDFPNSHREINIPFNRETNISIVQFTTEDSIPKGVVLYFHGNRKNIGWYARYATKFTSKNYEVWMIDYPGFGKSTGILTESRLYEYALQLYKLARTKYQPSQIIIYGKSMGTGIAAQLASIRDSKYLILETPYYSMTSLVSHFFPIFPVSRMLHYHLPTNEFIVKVTAPIVIFHGTNDRVVPFRNAKKLKPLLKEGDQFVVIEGGGHNNLNDFEIFHTTLDSLLR